MSNIIKGRRAVAEDGLVIDSNARVNEIFREIWQKKQAEGYFDNEDDDGEFHAGLNAPEVEDAETATNPVSDADRVINRLEKLLSPAEYSLLKTEMTRRGEEIINDANSQSARIIQDAVTDAKVREQEIFNAARDSGYTEGAKAAEEEYQNKCEALDAEYQERKAVLDKKIDELEPQFAGLVVKYVEKLTGMLAAEDYDTVILHSIDQALNDTSPSENYRIHVPREQFNYVSAHQEDIKSALGQAADVEVVADATMQVNQCSIETDKCVIDCSLETRLTKLINSLKLLSYRSDG